MEPSKKHDWHDWIDRLQSKNLTEGELGSFEEALRQDPAHTDEYLDALLVELALEAAGQPADPLEIGSVPAATKSVGGRFPMRAAAAIALLAAGSLCYVVGRSTGRQPVAVMPEPAEHVATVTDADEGAVANGFRIGQPLKSGTVEIPDGSKLGIAMRGGALLEVNGPADLRLEDPMNILLQKGRISTFAPPYAHGFTVRTEDGRIVDLGTRFVTAAGSGHGTEVHVVEGLVDAYLLDPGSKAQGLKKAEAAILKNGKLVPTDFLARRLDVPLDPSLADSDGDGIPNVVEQYYGSNPDEAPSVPKLTRLSESFGYKKGPLPRFAAESSGSFENGVWQGGGKFVAEGLSFESNGHRLAVSDGALQTAGESNIGANLHPLPRLAGHGVFYVSFLIRLDREAANLKNPFAGLLFYNDRAEEIFVGKVSHHAGFGSRFRRAPEEEYYQKVADTAVHLYVIRVDRTRLVTDVFLDPVLGLPESEATRNTRYQDVPEFDRISVRSGCDSALFSATFDEIRIGLTWDSVLPLAD